MSTHTSSQRTKLLYTPQLPRRTVIHYTTAALRKTSSPKLSNHRSFATHETLYIPPLATIYTTKTTRSHERRDGKSRCSRRAIIEKPQKPIDVMTGGPSLYLLRGLLPRAALYTMAQRASEIQTDADGGSSRLSSLSRSSQ